jgi:hypothetical protein
MSDFVVSVNAAGHIRERLRSLPPGAPITAIAID